MLGNNIKKEINKIQIPQELRQRSIQAILQAKEEMGHQNWNFPQRMNNKMKLLIGFVAMVSLVISASLLLEKEEFAANSSPSSMAASPYGLHEYALQEVADQIKVYNNLIELRNDASVIVEGKVIESIPLVQEGQIHTHSKVQILKDFKNGLNKGQVITFVEQGVGTPVMKLGDRVMIFASKGEAAGEEIYLPLGGFQGKFIVHDEYIERLVPDQLNGQYLSLRTSKNEFERMMKSK